MKTRKTISQPGDSFSHIRLSATEMRLLKYAPKMLETLKIAEKFYRDELEAMGGCDHDTNICQCDIQYQLEDLQSVIAKAEGKKDETV